MNMFIINMTRGYLDVTSKVNRFMNVFIKNFQGGEDGD